MIEAHATESALSKAQAISSKLVDETHRAIMLREMHARAGYEKDIVDAFGTSYESWGFNCVVTSVHFELIMTLMRIYDEDRATASVPTFMTLTSEEGLRRELLSEKIRWFADMYKRSSGSLLSPEKRAIIARGRGEEAYQLARSSLERAQERWQSLNGSHLLASLRRIRHKILAHNAVDSIELKVARKARFGDGDTLLDKTMEIVGLISVSIAGLEPNFEDDVAAWRTKATDFWAYAAHIRRERKGSSEP